MWRFRGTPHYLDQQAKRLGITQVLADRACRSMRDPLQIAGLIPPAKTPAQQDHVLRSVLSARDHALAALDAEDDGDYQEALRQWNIIYNGYFPQR